MKLCDVIMKGGVTSGVIYPRAVSELAKVYQLKNIGGTSAGAIAAAFAAAAEYSRQTGAGTGYAELEALPQWLAQSNRLRSLFLPDRGPKALFTLFLASLSTVPQPKKSFGVLRAILFSIYALPLFAGALPGIALLVIAGLERTNAALWVFGALLLLFGAAIGIAAGVAGDALRSIPRNGYGMTDGSRLSSWMADTIDRLAGLNALGEPLTFGRLWSPVQDPAHVAKCAPLADTDNILLRDAARQARVINLEILTASVSLGLPFKFPFDTKIFYFDPQEFRELFPERIVRWMIEHARPAQSPQEARRHDNLRPRLPFPLAADLPLVVAARMSMSVPLLFSQVPLYAVDWSLHENQKQPEKPRLERVWFTDGGAASNFPIHLFDAPLPRWPTFAIDLAAFHPDHPYDPADQCNNVWLPSSNAGGLDQTWNRFEARGPSVTGFVSAVLDTIVNWWDKSQERVPGWRDRIVHVHLRPGEGGMNLDMSPTVLQLLGQRGACAGEKLVNRFDWENHRWVRYRSIMSLYGENLRGFVQGYDEHQPGEPTYAQMIVRGPEQPPHSYEWQSTAQRAFAQTATGAFVALARQWSASDVNFSDGAPEPSPQLAVRPRL